MDITPTTTSSWRDKLWQWFMTHAQSNHALVWLAAIAFFDTIFLPIAPEFFLVALVAAHPKRWPIYLAVCIVFSTLGAAAGYFLAKFLFLQFGPWLLHTAALQGAFNEAHHLLRGRVFTTMALATFTPLPDKMFIYAAGFLGVRFVPYIVGYFVGRGIRMSIMTYVTARYGRRVIEVANKYAIIVGAVVVAGAVLYGMVRLHVFGL